MRFRLASLARSIVSYIVRHSSEDTRAYLRHAGLAVEDFTEHEHEPEWVRIARLRGGRVLAGREWFRPPASSRRP